MAIPQNKIARTDQQLPSFFDDDPSIVTPSTVSLVDEPLNIAYRLRNFGKVRCLALLASIFLILSVVFIVLFIVKKPPSKEDQTTQICDTMRCVDIAQEFYKYINHSVDPCDDFYSYACGGFLKTHKLSASESSESGFSTVWNRNVWVLKSALESVPVNYTQSTSLMKAHKIYKSCINTADIENQGAAPLENLISSYGGWRVTGSGFTNDWTVAEKMGNVVRDLGVDSFLTTAVETDLFDSSQHILQIGGSRTGMLADLYITDTTENFKIREAYKTYMKTISRLLGGGLVGDSKMMDIYNFEKQLAQAIKDNDFRADVVEAVRAHHRSGRSLDQLHNTLNKFSDESGFSLDFVLSFLNTAFQKQHYFTSSERVLYWYGDTYFAKLAILYSAQESGPENYAIIKDYIMWQVVDTYVAAMPSQFVEAKQKFKQVLMGASSETRWQQCIEGIMSPLGMAIGRLFVDADFQESSKATVKDMTSRMRQAFIDNLQSASWMDSSTKEKAKQKALAIKEDAGYPSYIKDTAKLDQEYDALTATSFFFENTKALLKYAKQENFNLYGKPVDKDKWLSSPAAVNAFYMQQQNRIAILAGILQHPFYSEGNPKYLNYGSLGMVVGHEITHAFDSFGRLFDKDGNLENWWSPNSNDRFKTRTQCLIDQYNKYKVFGRNIQGNQTINENIADNGGIKLAYEAYQAWVKDNKPEGRLPGVQLSVDQLFFVAMAQPWCNIYKKQAAYFQLKVDTHSFPTYRVIGTLSNYEKFSEAFSCPSGSRMNPSNKCSVW